MTREEAFFNELIGYIFAWVIAEDAYSEEDERSEE